MQAVSSHCGSLILGTETEKEVYIPPEEQDPQDLAWMREALVMVSY